MAFFASIYSRVLQSSAALAHHNRTKISRPPQCRSFSPLPPFSFPSKRIAFGQRGKRESSNSPMLASVTDISGEKSMEEFQLPKGDLCYVHKFGGTCVGSYERIRNVASRDDSYVSAVDAVFEKHRSTAHDLLDGDELAGFLSRLHHDIHNLKAMLRAKIV
ncbi:hypothetical protein Pint_28509 [Pistacia integerrima]|uniref:Uncharacterized protein n=1 Tax=Pistacia integerrima TaxID=434235 RepID=A0ACC0YNG4_9ROSI|nr:hypothetical protein Pint_28509 [Pistacia integerrima]